MPSSKKDTRLLEQDEQDTLRQRGIDLVNSGMKQIEVSRLLQVRPATVCQWMKMAKIGRSLTSRKRGPLTPPRKCLTSSQEEQLVHEIFGRPSPERNRIITLWTHNRLAELAQKKLGASLSRWTVSNYLNRWGILSRVPKSKDDAKGAVSTPASSMKRLIPIRDEARRENAAVWFLEPIYEIRVESCFVVSAINGRKERAFAVTDKNQLSAGFTTFLALLADYVNQKILLVLQRDQRIQSSDIASWAAEHHDLIRLIYST